MNSFYRRYPVGGLLVWGTKTNSAEDVETLEVASRTGFRCLTDLATFQACVEAEVLGWKWHSK